MQILCFITYLYMDTRRNTYICLVCMDIYANLKRSFYSAIFRNRFKSGSTTSPINTYVHIQVLVDMNMFVCRNICLKGSHDVRLSVHTSNVSMIINSTNCMSTCITVILSLFYFFFFLYFPLDFNIFCV